METTKKKVVVKYTPCIYGDKKLQEDPNYCMVHNSQRMKGGAFCSENLRQINDEVRRQRQKGKEPMSQIPSTPGARN